MNKHLILQTGIRFGVILGLVSIISSVLFFLLNLESKTLEGVLSLFLGAALVILLLSLAINQFKKDNKDTLSIGEGIMVGLWVGLISGAISGLYKYLEINYLNAEEVARQLKEQIIAMEENGMNEEQIEMSMKYATLMMEPYMLIPISIIWSIFIVAGVSLIISAILKKERSVFE
jgi:hypothetical protein